MAVGKQTNAQSRATFRFYTGILDSSDEKYEGVFYLICPKPAAALSGWATNTTATVVEQLKKITKKNEILYTTPPYDDKQELRL